MKGTYQIQIKGTSVDIEVTEFYPFVKGNTDAAFEFSYPDEDMEFEYRVDSGNTLLDLLLTEDYYEAIHEQLKKQLENLQWVKD